MTKQLFINKYQFAVTVFIALAISSIGVSFADGDGDHSHSAKSAPLSLSAQDKLVVATLEGYAKSVQSGDITKIEKYFVTDEGFTSLEGTFLDAGWASYREHLVKEMPMFNDVHYQLNNIRPYVNGDMAYAIMDTVMNITIKSDRFEGGEHKLAMKGKATMVLTKSNNEWKIRHIQTAREAEKRPEGTGSNPH